MTTEAVNSPGATDAAGTTDDASATDAAGLHERVGELISGEQFSTAQADRDPQAALRAGRRGVPGVRPVPRAPGQADR